MSPPCVSLGCWLAAHPAACSSARLGQPLSTTSPPGKRQLAPGASQQGADSGSADQGRGEGRRTRPAWAWQLDAAPEPHPGSCCEDGHSGAGAGWLLPGGRGAAGGSQSVQTVRTGGQYRAAPAGLSGHEGGLATSEAPRGTWARETERGPSRGHCPGPCSLPRLRGPWVKSLCGTLLVKGDTIPVT